MRERLDWALRLARCGFHIFPIVPGTKAQFFPGEKWKDIMTRDEATIRRWFAERDDMNYGVCPGDGAGVVDLDLKPQIDGIAAFELLAMEHDGDPTETFVVESASGGRHLYYRTPFRVSNANTFPDGIDARGGGGYVVGPGSALQKGSYRAIKGRPEKLAPAPSWILDHWKRDTRQERETEPVFELDSEAAINRARALLRQRDPAIEGEGGDLQTYMTFCLLRDEGVSKTKALELVVEPDPATGLSWNDRCEPPWSLEGQDSLSAKAENAYSYASNRPAAKGGSPEEVFGSFEDGELPQDAATVPDAEPGRANKWEARIKIGEAITSIKPIPQLIDDWLPARGITAVLAQRGDGKTVMLLDLALRMACDQSWHSLSINKPVYPIYLCGEDPENTAGNHHKAWCKVHNGGESPENFAFVEGVPRLLDPEDISGFVSAMLPKVPKGRQPVIFVDTWQRAISGTSQNDEDKMALAIENVEAMASHFRNCPILVAFHPPKAARNEDLTITGSAWQENATHAIWKLFPHRRKADSYRLLVDRIKGPGRGSARVFQWATVEIGQDDQTQKPMVGVVAELIAGHCEVEDFRDDVQTVARLIMERINSPKKVRKHGDQGHPIAISYVLDVLTGLGIANNKDAKRAWLEDNFSKPVDLGDGHTVKLYHQGNGHYFKIV